MVDETLPLRLSGGVCLRRECFGGIAQVGPLGYLLNPRACTVLERLARPSFPRDLLEDCGTPSATGLRRFLSSCRVANLIEIAPDESMSRARLYGVHSADQLYRRARTGHRSCHARVLDRFPRPPTLPRYPGAASGRWLCLRHARSQASRDTHRPEQRAIAENGASSRSDLRRPAPQCKWVVSTADWPRTVPDSAMIPVSRAWDRAMVWLVRPGLPRRGLRR